MSEAFTTSEIVDWTGGELLAGDGGERFRGVSIDTRSIAAGDLFIAIAGPNFDAHRFLDQALDAGAGGLVVEAGRGSLSAAARELPCVAVPDTTRALGDLARGHRSRFAGPVVALTGSSGKTTTKEMCAAVLSVSAPCLKTEGNLNNDFGLPLTLLRREAEHRRVVVELGMNHRGEIARLAEIAQPDVAVLTNIGSAHIEHLGSTEEIAAEKGDLFAALDARGVAVANRDDPLVSEQAKRCRGRVLGYGRSPEADVRGEEVRYLDEGAYAFQLATASDRVEVEVAGLGETTVINALAAAATGVACGLELAEVARGLAAYRPPGGRMTRRELSGGATLIDDTYNANPQSMQAALESLARLKGRGRATAVLGDMGELGDSGEAAHVATGARAGELGVDFLVALGKNASAYAKGARDAGMASARIHLARDHAEAGRIARDLAGPEDWILVKGSRAARMERVVELLAAEETA
ncbi:MAG: UDP-N-acetylmuramoyl-tripeptide--D-alanyl-D-alanine ligase [Deltaproteobacteria bacterium]|nr:UDP-N-acetylmuramoyl-tripeptide--D-alanyl-D-alanine ligase [Deltaproteobacteria bacterium]MBW2417040.1 UDP-N-acetylmuramoyl-tripeptide--D-alanyl-D-alanine ligase [Deltaproteobacteria bacterium]